MNKKEKDYLNKVGLPELTSNGVSLELDRLKKQKRNYNDIKPKVDHKQIVEMVVPKPRVLLSLNIRRKKK